MAIDIRQKILRKYQIDVDEKNIIKLYKIKSEEISEPEIRELLTHKKSEWEHIVNSGTNEAQIKKAAGNLEKANAYERILSDKKLRRQLFRYYQDSKTDMKLVASSRKFFAFVATSKRITSDLIDFYFEYYKEERAHKSAIVQFLNEKYHLNASGETTTDSSPVVVSKKHHGFVRNSFSKETLLTVNECVRYYQEAIRSDIVKEKFQGIEESLYHYLRLEEITTRRDFAHYIDTQKDNLSNIRYEFGQEFSPLVDMFNTLAEVIELEEIYDNYDVFDLLIRYDKLTPYMYCMENINKTVINRLFEIAAELYDFSDIGEFLRDYFIPIYSHFNLHISDIKSIVRKSMVIRKPSSVNSEFKLKGSLNLLFFLAYWPLLLFYTMERLLKILIDNIKYFSYFMSGLVFTVLLLFGPTMYHLDYRLIRRIGKQPWVDKMEHMYHHMDKNLFINNTRSLVMFSVLTVLILFTLYLGPVIFTQYFLTISASKIVKTIDTATIDRTLQSYLISCQDRIKANHDNKENYKTLSTILVNLLLFGVILWGLTGTM